MKYFSYILVFAVIFSCTSRTIYKKPDDLISKEQMIELWTDIYIANGAKNLLSITEKPNEKKINYMPLVYEKYQIDSARFMRSNIYYTSKIDDYEKMFKVVQENLKELRNQYEKKKDTVKVKPVIEEEDD